MAVKLTPTQIEREMQRMEDIQNESLADQLLLWSWGRWSGKDYAELGYPPCLIKYVDRSKSAWEKDLRKIPPGLSDDEGMRIDAAVSRLPFSHRKVIITRYKAMVPHRRMSDALAWSDRRISQLHSEAIGMLYAWLKTA